MIVLTLASIAAVMAVASGMWLFDFFDDLIPNPKRRANNVIKMYRQGDLLIVQMTNRDEFRTRFAVEVEDRILAYGEATGHAHRIEEGADVTVWAPSPNQHTGLVIDARKRFRIRHEEHAPLDLPSGLYRVVRQREFDGTQSRMVSD